MAAHLHILGICGTFMGGLAAIARQAGFRVTGCDANVYPPMSEQLASLGIELTEGYDAGQMTLAPDLWVVGNVVTRGNPLMEAILDAGARYVSGPQWLADRVLPGRHVLAVAGTHGKTGTASMLAWILERAGRAPGFLVGGLPVDFGVSARLGQSSCFVIEADEYDTAFFDKRSKFVHYPAKTTILNNLEFDHADIFGDIAAIERQFHHFVRILPSSGKIVVNGQDEALARVLGRGCWTPVERFGVATEWQAGEPDAQNGFEVLWQGKSLGRVRWSQAGAHNRMNALAAIAAARHAGVEPRQAIEALASFGGVRRRLERRGEARGIVVYDDFAHHPTAIRTTLEGLRARVGGARILAVLEPRSNTMRLGTMKDRLAASLDIADRVFVYAADLGWDAADALRPLGPRARSFDDLDALVAAVAAEARPGEHVLVMSNGSFGGVHGRLLRAIEARAAA
ncbi:MAG: UDP-N-acetylmuramate:L-alanyl-gamma-D-glutamyl-meso-diaminopimelate ligase [Betaproteobacteria bacterium]|nr:UDP-N-acetylmuramate:L-alanyl-gamma-D-glutamyl-meso-diaminopimelate ligase [Betaproteobacteria bacterium]MDH5349418.1 UDP-N-acetylmuramate:L-alanyl-gamma-D-glutamyl-meso-diaminopimelate ligase [Betaproteobacteria bacterium]